MQGGDALIYQCVVLVPSTVGECEWVLLGTSRTSQNIVLSSAESDNSYRYVYVSIVYPPDGRGGVN